jgi:Tfp pilus assembly protein PilW
MRWLLIALLISVVVLLLVAGAVVWHVRRQRRAQPDDLTGAPESSEEIRKGDS